VASVWCCGAPCRAGVGGGNFPRPKRNQSRPTPALRAGLNQAPPATCARLQPSSFQQASASTGRPGASEQPAHVGKPSTVFNCASTAAVLEHFRGQLLLLTHAAPPSVGKPLHLAGGLPPRNLRRCWRQHPSSTGTYPESLPSRCWRAIRRPAAAGSMRQPPWPPWAALGLSSPRTGGKRSGGYGSIKPSSASCPAMTDVRRRHVARNPPRLLAAGLWPEWRPMACAYTEVVFSAISPPGARRRPRTAGGCPPARP